MIPLDVRSDASVAGAVRTILHEAGRIDVLVNNAGFSQTGAIEENSLSDAQAQFDTNVFGVLRVTNAVLPAMREQRRGHVVNVSSVLGQVAPGFMGLYASTKFALEGLSEAWRAELAPLGIYVSLVEPAFVRTRIEGRLPANPLGEYARRRDRALAFVNQGIEQGMPAEAVAVRIRSAIEERRPRLRYRVGRSSTVLITLKRLLPEAAFDRLRQRAFPGEARDLAAAGAR
jgi:NAD(P)-dependent dehydrogenase (short-subunit alcohol dehydrogenase family)